MFIGKYFSNEMICDNALCKNKTFCENAIKYLFTYGDKNNDNVLTFDPVFVKFNNHKKQ